MSSDDSLNRLQIREAIIKGSVVTQIYDVIRKQWIKAQPEEVIRQNLIQWMIDKLGYPRDLIVVEREFYLLPHLVLTDQESLPQRRVDILCFARNIHSQFDLYPLLMIECKATTLNEKVWRQVVGYNSYIQAHFVAIANKSKIQLGWYEDKKKDYQTIDFLPSYSDLLQKVSSYKKN